MKTRDVRSLHTRRSFQRYCKEKLKSVLRRVSFSSMLNFCRFLIPDFLRIKLFGCSGGNALLVLTWAKKTKYSEIIQGLYIHEVFLSVVKSLITSQLKKVININGPRMVNQCCSQKNRVVFFDLRTLYRDVSIYTL